MIAPISSIALGPACGAGAAPCGRLCEETAWVAVRVNMITTSVCRSVVGGCCGFGAGNIQRITLRDVPGRGAAPLSRDRGGARQRGGYPRVAFRMVNCTVRYSIENFKICWDLEFR